ncbi:phage major capsid protein [Singulisphaera sp. PoT]|uniref:phage major capsid protein n=1 Tax=Singulisphaera sp. PoT TaxID=3411797 RepID=UPI003BF5D025
MPTALETMAGQLQQKRQELSDIFEKSKQADGTYDLDAAGVDDVRKRNAELDDLGKKYAQARDLCELESKNRAEADRLDEVTHPSRHGHGRVQDDGRKEPPARKSLGQLVVESRPAQAALADIKSGGQFRPYRVDLPDFDLHVKATMAETGAGYAPPNYRTNIVVFSPQRRPVVADLIPQDPTDQQAIKYMEETTFANAAAMTAEAGGAPESSLAYSERTVLVEWLPTTLPVTEQQLEDVPQLNGIINNRLSLMIQLSEEVQILSGNGTSPQLKGFLGGGLSGIQTQALGGDPPLDAVLKAMTLVRFTGFADPSGVVIHPNNWQTIRLLRTSTGAYLMGAPSEAGPEMVWGMPAVVTPAISAGTALLGDFLKFAHISRRRGLRVEVGFVNDDFKKGQKTLRADERLALEVYRPSAFCTITGLQ